MSGRTRHRGWVVRGLALAMLPTLLGCSLAIGLDGGKPEVCKPGATIACYTGPVATKDVGACKSGTQTCNAAGSGFGACKGELLPMPDACESPGVGSCDGASCGDALWALEFGPALPPLVAVDPAGNTFIAGGLEATIMLGSTMLFIPAGGSEVDIYLAKLDAKGNVQWAQQFGSQQDQIGNGLALAVDVNGDVVLSGYFLGQDKIDFGAGSIAAGPFLAKFDGSGVPQWSMSLGSSLNGIAIDGDHDLLVTGSVAGTIDLGGGTVTWSGPSPAAFVAKLGPDGSYLWSKVFGDAMTSDNHAKLSSIAADPDGNAVVGGTVDGMLTFGSVPVSAGQNGSALVVKLDTSGNVVTAESFGDASSVASVAVDAQSDIFLSGSFGGTIKFGSASVVAQGGALRGSSRSSIPAVGRSGAWASGMGSTISRTATSPQTAPAISSSRACSSARAWVSAVPLYPAPAMGRWERHSLRSMTPWGAPCGAPPSPWKTSARRASAWRRRRPRTGSRSGAATGRHP